MASHRDEDRIEFKRAFVTRCRAAGMDNRQILQFVKAANVKQAKTFWGWNDDGDTRTWYQEYLDPPLTSSQWAGPHGLTGGASPFVDALDRWYNGFSNSTRSTEKGEEWLRIPGQISMGVGAGAATAAGVLAGLPLVGGSSVGATPLFGTTNATGTMLPTLSGLLGYGSGAAAGGGAAAAGGGTAAAGGGTAAAAGGGAAATGGGAAAAGGGTAAAGGLLNFLGRWGSRAAVADVVRRGWNAVRGAGAGLGAAAPWAAAAAIGVPMAAGLALGGLGGHTAAKITEPEENEEDIKAREIETAYKIRADRMRARRAYAQYRQSRDQNGLKEKTSSSWLGVTGGLLFGAPMAAGLALGGLGGHAAAKMTEPEENEEDIKAREIEMAYRAQANRLRARRAYEEYRKQRQQQS